MLIDFQEKLTQKNDRIEKEFMEIISQFKDQEAITEINENLIKLEKTSPALFKMACNYIKEAHNKLMSKHLPDIIA